MSNLTVDTQWIVGEPSKGVQLAEQVENWVTQQTGWFPVESQQREIDGLFEEIRTKYEHGSEGWFAFATEIVDAVLNRLYPYLINYSQDANYKITSDRKEVLTPELDRVIVYTLDGVPSGNPKPDEGESKPPEADSNPFPRPPEIDPSTVPIPPGSPIDPYGPEFPGLPYDPLNPLQREPNPYPPRQEQPNIPFQPGQPVNPDSPIQERPPYQFNENRDLPPVVFPPRSGEIQIQPIPSETTEGEGGEPPPGEDQTPPVTGEENPPPQQGDDISKLLLAILQEIIRQGGLNRSALQDAVLAIQGTIVQQGVTQDEAIQAASELIADSLGNDLDATNYLLTDIKGIIQKAYDDQERIEGELTGTLEKGLTDAVDAAQEIEDALRNRIGDALDDTNSALTDIYNALISGLPAIAENIIGLGETVVSGYLQGVKQTLDFITTATEFNVDDINHYICEFLTALGKIKNECSWFAGKAS